MTGLIRDLLIRLFSTPMNIRQRDLRRLVWREDERTGILIESIYRWRANLVEKRPAVIIKPNNRKNIRVGIGDILLATEQGHKQYQTFWMGSHTLFCLHGSGASVEILASEVDKYLTAFAPEIRRALDLYNFQVTEVSAPAILEESKDNYVCAVVVGWIYDHRWALNLESIKLGSVPLSVLLDGALIE